METRAIRGVELATSPVVDGQRVASAMGEFLRRLHAIDIDIDWGDLCVAHPSVDLSFVWNSLAPADRAAYAHDSGLDVLLASTLRRLGSLN